MIDALIVSNVLLWCAVVILGLVVLALLRQIGVLYERVAPAGALMVNQALKAGEPAPEMDVLSLRGGTIHVGGESATGRCLLLFFLGPRCPICKSLLPVVRSIAEDERGWLDVVLASDGPVEEHMDYVRAQNLEGFDYVVSSELGMRCGVGKLPYALLVDERGLVTAMGIVNSREHLESLFEARERGVASIQAYLDKRATGQ